jgi:photosystem II stability/assembly factor-like uncharacterized protein
MRTGPLLAAAALAAAVFPTSLAPRDAAAAQPPVSPDTTVRRPAPKPAASGTPAPDTVKFRALGPAVSGGRVAAVAGSDRDPDLYYVGGAGGGVFKSQDGGTSFAPAWDGPRFGSIGAIAIAPSDEKTVWVGTGEANPRNDVSYGNGVYVTHDGAKHWLHAGLEGTKYISKILVDPKHPNHAIVAALGDIYQDSTQRGVYVTNDGGSTWQKTLYVGPQSGAADLAWNPKDPRTVYAAIWQFRRKPWTAVSGGTADGLYRSGDGGRTWAKVTGNGFPGGVIGRIGVAIAPSNPRRIYAEVQSKAGTIWRSDDAGTHWTRMTADSLPAQRPFYFSHLAVDPTNANRVISLSMYLTVTKDGGKSWRHLEGYLHPDNHAVWWSANGKRIIEGNDGGVVLSRNGGGTWAFLDRIPLAQIYHVGYDMQKPYTICGGLQDNSSWCAPTTSRNGTGILNRDWFAIAGGDGMYAIPDPTDPSLIWTNTQDGVLAIYDGKARQSIDVSPFPRDVFTGTDSLAHSPYRFNWNAPLAFAPDDGHVVYFGGNAVFKTTDRGRHWTPISPDLTRNEKEHQLAAGGPISLDVSGAEYYDTLLAIAPSPQDPQVIWTGSDDGLVHLTRDGGAHWSDVTPKGWPKYGRVKVVEASPQAAGTAFAVLDRHDLGDNRPYVVATNDYGATWRDITSNLPRDVNANVVRQDPHQANLLYVGTENGLWLSYDRGGRWEPLKAGLPVVPVYDIHVHPSENDLLVATHGRGFFVLDDATPLQQLASARAAKVTFFPVREATLWAGFPSVEPGDSGSMPSNNFVGGAAPSGAVLTFYLHAKAAQRPWVEILDAQGHAIRTLRGAIPQNPDAEPSKEEAAKFYVTNDAGLNRLTWDGTEQGPARWLGTSFQNQGQTSGAEALPGTYTARLHVDGATYDQKVTLVDDPLSPWSAEQRTARHAYLTTVFGWLDQVDRALNAIDAKLKTATPAQKQRLIALQAELTANDLHDEDSIAQPDRIREQIGGLAGSLGGAIQPPFSQHDAALQALRPKVEQALRDASSVLGVAFGPAKSS